MACSTDSSPCTGCCRNRPAVGTQTRPRPSWRQKWITAATSCSPKTRAGTAVHRVALHEAGQRLASRALRPPHRLGTRWRGRPATTSARRRAARRRYANRCRPHRRSTKVTAIVPSSLSCPPAGLALDPSTHGRKKTGRGGSSCKSRVSRGLSFPRLPPLRRPDGRAARRRPSGVVAIAEPTLQDAQVAAVAGGVARTLVEERRPCRVAQAVEGQRRRLERLGFLPRVIIGSTRRFLRLRHGGRLDQLATQQRKLPCCGTSPGGGCW